MKKKHLNEGCTYEREETTPKHAEFISVDQVNRYMLQMTEEEQDTMSFRDVIAGILRTKPENIKSMKRSGLGWRVKALGGMDDLESILDDNVGTLKRLKGTEDEEWADDENEWMTPREMAEAEGDDPEDWQDDLFGDEADDESRMDFYAAMDGKYEVDRERGLVRLRPEFDKWVDSEENEWMTPEEMGIAQKMDWSDADGDEISDEEKMAYFQSKSDMYDVDMENGLVRLKPEDDWFDSEDDMEDWEREGYNSEIAYQNRWRDYED